MSTRTAERRQRRDVAHGRWGLAALVLAAVGCTAKDAPRASSAAPGPAVVVARVEQRTVPIQSEFVARTEAVATVDLVARVEGFLKEARFKEGQPVKKDQLLFLIDPRQYEANLTSARAKVSQAKAQLGKARQDVERYKPLAAESAIPQQDLDTAIASEASAAADLEAANASLDKARLDLSYCTIRAPFDGLIGRINVYPGNLVGRGQPTVLSTISALDPIQVTFGIAEAGYLQYRRRFGKPTAPELELVLADNSVYPHLGKFRMAERAIDLKTGTLTIMSDFPNPDGVIRPNQFGRVRLVVDTAEGALLVPQKAVTEQQSAKVVLVVGEGNKVAHRTVTLGARYRDSVIVTDGLKAGELVIVEGHQKARPGMVVSPTDQPVSQEAQGK